MKECRIYFVPLSADINNSTQMKRIVLLFVAALSLTTGDAQKVKTVVDSVKSARKSGNVKTPEIQIRIGTHEKVN